MMCNCEFATCVQSQAALQFALYLDVCRAHNDASFRLLFSPIPLQGHTVQKLRDRTVEADIGDDPHM